MAADGVDMLNIFRRLLETSNPAEFTAKFTGQNRDVLPFIFEIDKFAKVNGLTDEGVKFRRIFNTIDIHFQNLFMEDQDENAELTVESLKTWLISKFPPPPMKHEWLFKLKSIKMRKNEDPKLVFDKFQTILSRVDDAIDYTNKNRTRAGRVRGVTNEQIIESLKAIFIRNNNQSKFGNDGVINQKVITFIYKRDPATFDDWTQMFTDMQTQLIPNCFKSLKDWQYITYPTNVSDYDIYKKPSNRPEDNKPERKTTKKETGKKRKRRQTFNTSNKKRKYNRYCGRCGRNNHEEVECFATHNVFGKPIRKRNADANDNANNYNNHNNKPNKGRKYCKRCKRTNHYTNECNASFYPDRTPINDGKFPRNDRRNNGPNDKNNNRNNKEFYTKKQNDKTSTNDLLTLLTQKISNNKDLDTDKQFQCLSLLNDLQNNMSARQGK